MQDDILFLNLMNNIFEINYYNFSNVSYHILNFILTMSLKQDEVAIDEFKTRCDSSIMLFYLYLFIHSFLHSFYN